MKPALLKRFAFIGKSMLWSLLLYVTMMLVFNWDDVRNTVYGNNKITVINNALPDQETPVAGNPNVSGHAGFINNVIMLMKTISGISG